MKVEVAALPEALTLEEAVEAAYASHLDDLQAAVLGGARVLLEVDPELMPFLYRVLAARLAAPVEGEGLRCHYVSGRPRTVALGSVKLEVHAGRTARMRDELEDLLRESDPGLLLVVPHFELLATIAGAEASRESRELVATLHDHPEARVLALHAPDVEVPGAVSRCFRRGGIGDVPVERLRHVVLQREARKFCVEWFDGEEFLASVGQLSVVALRRALEGIADRADHVPGDDSLRRVLYAELAARARSRERVHTIPPPEPDPGSSTWVLRDR